MNGGDEDGVLVGSGGFKVDRAHALRKLSEFQVPRGFAGWLFWARCAAAGGADTVEVKDGFSSLTVRFGGEPLTRAELEDPYAPLLGGPAARRERGRQFALGLLQALRGGATVTAESGSGSARLRMSAGALGESRVEPAPGGDGTVLTATWKVLTEASAAGFSYGHADSFGPSPLFHQDRLLALGRRGGAWPHEDRIEARSRLGGVRIALALPDYAVPPDSLVHLYKLGVFVAEHRESLPWAKVEAWVSDDKLPLDASESGAVRGPRLGALMRELGRRTEALARECAEGFPKLLESAQAAVHAHPAAREVWTRRLRWGPEAAAAAAGPGVWERLVGGDTALDAARSLALRSANRAVWLRDVEARLARPGRTPPPGLGEAVARARALAVEAGLG